MNANLHNENVKLLRHYIDKLGVDMVYSVIQNISIEVIENEKKELLKLFPGKIIFYNWNDVYHHRVRHKVCQKFFIDVIKKNEDGKCDYMFVVDSDELFECGKVDDLIGQMIQENADYIQAVLIDIIPGEKKTLITYKLFNDNISKIPFSKYGVLRSSWASHRVNGHSIYKMFSRVFPLYHYKFYYDDYKERIYNTRASRNDNTYTIMINKITDSNFNKFVIKEDYIIVYKSNMKNKIKIKTKNGYEMFRVEL
jgi:hypothetical protein